MWKSVGFITSYIIFVFINSSTSIDIECSYQVNSYTIVERIYDCRVNNNPNITAKTSTAITSINENHVGSRTSDDVHGIWASSKTIHYFPTGFDKFFKNIKAIYIYVCGLKEIHQVDLKAFPELIYIYLSGNSIEVIEDGLFDFNTKLEFIGLNEKNIIHIDPNVLDELDKLRYFRGLNIPCVGLDAVNSKDAVEDVRNKIQENCVNLEFAQLDDKLDEMANELDPQEFLIDFINFEVTFNGSKFKDFRPLSVKYTNLKIIEITNKNLYQKSSNPHRNCNPVDSDEFDTQSESCKISNDKFIEFALKTEERFEKIEQNLASTRHIIAINLNEKMKEVEKQLMMKFEDIIEEKLRKILDENQRNDIDVRVGGD